MSGLSTNRLDGILFYSLQGRFYKTLLVSNGFGIPHAYINRMKTVHTAAMWGPTKSPRSVCGPIPLSPGAQPDRNNSMSSLWPPRLQDLCVPIPTATPRTRNAECMQKLRLAGDVLRKQYARVNIENRFESRCAASRTNDITGALPQTYGGN
jgi:hypothetical protein